MIIKIASVDSVILYFEQVISEKVLDEVQETYLKIKNLKGVTEIIPSYCSILISYDIFRYNHESIKKAILKICSEPLNLSSSYQEKNKLIQIPTDYNNNLDLPRVANFNKLTIEEVIDLHSKATYRVYAIGFIVGFAYLASVSKKIATPRLETPRSKVPKGSVAIADNQTAIYPQDSAGGWNIIGHTTFNEFDTLSVGDSIQFVSI